MALPDLLTLTEYKLMVGMNPTNTKDDDKIKAALSAASRSIRMFTDRKFEVASGPATERKFQWDGSQILDIDDCTEVTGVSWNGGWVGSQDYAMDPDEFTAMPYRETEDDDPHFYLVLEGGPGHYSPQMGFTRNLDTLPVNNARPAMVTITARWGWESVPSDVKLATSWTILDTLNKPSAGDLQSEAIAGYSRSWAVGAAAAGMAMGVPARSRDLLTAYLRPF